jgi:hypothetical protein
MYCSTRGVATDSRLMSVHEGFLGKGWLQWKPARSMDQFPECRILQSSPKLFDILPILAGDLHENDWSDLGFILEKKSKKKKQGN